MGIIKTKEEIELLRKAAMIGQNCFDYLCTTIKPGMTENMVAQMVSDFLMKYGASKLSFDPIVGSGVNSSQIHSTPTDRMILEDDIILLDFGCVYEGYCSDMSRTIFIGKPTEKQQEIYELVWQTYQNAVSCIKPGMKANEADALGRDGIVARGYNYAHALGHGVGQEVHEDPLLSPKREDILAENMVFSIEPGIYLENEFGVRIEDVGALTSEGLTMFSTPPDKIVVL